MMLKPVLLLLIIALCSTSCLNQDRDREKQLDIREQALKKREAEFDLKNAEYKTLLMMRDSLMSVKDSVKTMKWPKAAAGLWHGKSVCTESNCSDFAVGDQRADNWEFSADSTGIFTRITDRGKLTRVYSATADSLEYKLHFASDTSASRKVVIDVLLKPESPGLIKGTQTISVNNKCTATFSVELERSSNL